MNNNEMAIYFIGTFPMEENPERVTTIVRVIDKRTDKNCLFRLEEAIMPKYKQTEWEKKNKTYSLDDAVLDWGIEALIENFAIRSYQRLVEKSYGSMIMTRPDGRQTVGEGLKSLC